MTLRHDLGELVGEALLSDCNEFARRFADRTERRATPVSCAVGLRHASARIGGRLTKARLRATRAEAVQPSRTEELWRYGRGGFRTCDLSRVKRALSH